MQGRAAAVVHVQFFARPLLHIAAEIHEANRLDHVKYRSAHRAGVHAQAAANGSRNAFEEFQARQAVAFGFHRHRFQFRSRPAVQALALDFDPAEMAVRQANGYAAEATVFDQQI